MTDFNHTLIIIFLYQLFNFLFRCFFKGVVMLFEYYRNQYHMPKLVKITLNTPIKRGETDITDITLREPKAGELRKLDVFDLLRMNVSAHRILIPRICELTANEFDELPPSDLVKIQTEINLFFQGPDQ